MEPSQYLRLWLYGAIPGLRSEVMHYWLHIFQGSTLHVMCSIQKVVFKPWFGDREVHMAITRIIRDDPANEQYKYAVG